MFTSITLDRTDWQLCARCPCVCLLNTQRLIWNMTYLDHLSGQMTWCQVKFLHWPIGVNIQCVSMRLHTTNTVKQGISLCLKVQTLFAKMIQLKNNILGWYGLQKSRCDLRWKIEYGRIQTSPDFPFRLVAKFLQPGGKWAGSGNLPLPHFNWLCTSIRVQCNTVTSVLSAILLRYETT